MNFDVAKQLEQAGFPQGGDGKWIAPPDKLIVRNSDRVYVPTLEELIEACDGLGSLYRTVNGQSWYATTRTNDLTKDGSTPTEAVARLWLALNKKA